MNVVFFGIEGSIHTAESGNTALAVSSGNTLIMVDCSGNPVQSLKKSDLNPENLSALLLTHVHIDHLYALPSLLHNLWLLKRTEALPVFAEKNTLETARTLCAVFALEQKKGMYPIIWNTLENAAFKIGELQIEAFDVNHNVACKGLVFTADNARKLVYFADTAPMNRYPACVYDAETLIHECAAADEPEEKVTKSGHCTPAQTAQVAKNVRAKKLYLCHLPESDKKITQTENEVRRLSSIPVMVPELFRPYVI